MPSFSFKRQTPKANPSVKGLRGLENCHPDAVSYRLSGLSPFLGDTDAETLNNILACRWDLEDAEFQDVSEEAREFISKLLIKEKR